MPNVITTIRPTTEVQAINVMLGAIGEAKLPDATNLTTASSTDANVEQAVEVLRESVREMLNEGWRFNTLTGFELNPTTTYAWVDSQGVSTSLNIFKLPADCLKWTLTPCSQNLGIELIERRSLKYQETAAPAMVLFDRVKNRDGVEASKYPHIYIDEVFAVDFTDMPEAARRYATVLAARRLCQRVPGSAEEAQFSEKDELGALRLLKREQGLPKRLNLFQTVDAQEIGGRRRAIGGGYSTRVFPGGV